MASRRKPVAKLRTPAKLQSSSRSSAAAGEPSALLQALKRCGPLTIRGLAAELGITYEAVRQQIAELLRAGWVSGERPQLGRADPAAANQRDGSLDRRPGPASRRYGLSAAAEHVFPKHYDDLSVDLVRHVLERFGGIGVAEILGRMTDERVRHWAPRVEGLGLREKLKALSSLYEEKDAYMEVEWQQGAPALIERNCPFFSVAQAHPAICSVSVNTLERLLGFKVVREQRFQQGQGRCVFRLKLEEPRQPDEAFKLES